MNKKFLFLIVVLCSASLLLANQRRAFFEMYSDFINVPPICYNKSLLGYYNPAGLYFVKGSDLRIYWSDSNRKLSDYNTWAIFMGGKGTGLGVIKENFRNSEIYNTRISYAIGRENVSLGFSYGTGTGDGYFKRDKDSYWVFGMLVKSHSILSVGGTLLIENYSDYKEESYYFVITPFNNQPFSLIYEHHYQSCSDVRKLVESYSMYLKFLKRFNINAKIFHDRSFNIGVGLNISNIELINNVFFDKQGVYENK
ncbi:hypothetical protein ACFL5N_01595, partial [bacterium]